MGKKYIGLNENNIKSLTKFYEMIIEFSKKVKELDLIDLIYLVLDKTGYIDYLKEDKTIYRVSRLENVMEFVSSPGDYEELYGDISLFTTCYTC